MSKAVKSIFGGTDRSAQRATQAQNEQSRQFIQQQMGQAQNYLTGAMPGIQESARQGFGGAFDITQQAMPAQINAMQQGNIAAQNYLIGGMPAFQNALMGMPVNYGQFQPTQMQFQIPRAQFPQLPANMGQPMTQQPQVDLSQLLSGQVRF